ncbi:MAG: hypothetical protein KatS3mg103_1459 [Phycisphaerales bacterium]|nr:MAG: hypothetical protein KatS3mg103_1459 [Phycisphaerales bacterium]
MATPTVRIQGPYAAVNAMPRVEGFESTPNPQAVKIVLASPLAYAPRAYRHPPGPACTDALAQALYAIEGVRVVLIHHRFVTIGKAPHARWPTIKRKAKAAIEAYEEPTEAPPAPPAQGASSDPTGRP